LAHQDNDHGPDQHRSYVSNVFQVTEPNQPSHNSEDFKDEKQ
jgi:hypothetical protein